MKLQGNLQSIKFVVCPNANASSSLKQGHTEIKKARLKIIGLLAVFLTNAEVYNICNVNLSVKVNNLSNALPLSVTSNCPSLLISI